MNHLEQTIHAIDGVIQEMERTREGVLRLIEDDDLRQKLSRGGEPLPAPDLPTTPGGAPPPPSGDRFAKSGRRKAESGKSAGARATGMPPLQGLRSKASPEESLAAALDVVLPEFELARFSVEGAREKIVERFPKLPEEKLRQLSAQLIGRARSGKLASYGEGTDRRYENME